MLGIDIDALSDYSSKIVSKKISEILEQNIEIPLIQRIKNEKKVEEIIKYHLDFHKNKHKWNILGVINIHYCTETNSYYLIDGQHRFSALKKLYNNYGHNIKVRLEVVKVPNYIDLQENYKLINKNTPLPDLPDNIDVNILEKVVSYFSRQYDEMISSKLRANRPHIGFNRFQEATSVLIEYLNINESNKIIAVIEDHNKTLSGWDKDKFPDYRNISDNMWSKCHNNKFYLGLYKFKSDDYCFKWVKDIVQYKTGKTLKAISKSRKKPIPKKVKTECWDKWIGKKRTGNCKCCGKEIDVLNFHAGHIISEKNGGQTTISNLIPLCSPCNLSMATENCQTYMEKYYPDNWEKIKQEFI